MNLDPITTDAILIYDHWKTTIYEVLSNKQKDLRFLDSPEVIPKIISSGCSDEVARLNEEIIRGVVFSMLSILSGATSASETGTITVSINGTGIDMTDIQNKFIYELINSGRIK
ncbi:hypothetical protein LBMAG53_34140 [Planctomycetota bacterium]|nr:hypothetical protein LBMAG53_34140 [Planctomycetota bacterium]